MPVLVSDTSILIELERGQFLEAMFGCGLVFVVPDLLFGAELADGNGPYLRKLGLGVIALNGDELTAVQQLKLESNKLSLPDCSALICGRRPDHSLLTGDWRLRAEAERLGLTVRGSLWVIDQLELAGNIAGATLHAGLTQMAAHHRCWLPKSEIAARLKKWS
jgi:hypothetical protein